MTCRIAPQTKPAFYNPGDFCCMLKFEYVHRSRFDPIAVHVQLPPHQTDQATKPDAFINARVAIWRKKLRSTRRRRTPPSSCLSAACFLSGQRHVEKKKAAPILQMLKSANRTSETIIQSRYFPPLPSRVIPTDCLPASIREFLFPACRIFCPPSAFATHGNIYKSRITRRARQNCGFAFEHNALPARPPCYLSFLSSSLFSPASFRLSLPLRLFPPTENAAKSL